MGELKIGRMVLGVCQTNCYFVYREDEPYAVVVDPADKGQNIYDALRRNGFRVAGIISTISGDWTDCGTRPMPPRRRTERSR